MRLIAIVGMAGAGKTEFSKIMEQKGYKRIRFGDITDELLEKKDLPVTEENEKKIREEIRKIHGMAAYAILNHEKISKDLEEYNVVIDGLYSWEEYLYLLENFPEIIVVAMYADPETRYARLNEREVRSLTREQALGRDHAEIQNLKKAGPIAMAQYTVLNIGTLFDLENKFDEFLEWSKKTLN